MNPIKRHLFGFVVAVAGTALAISSGLTVTLLIQMRSEGLFVSPVTFALMFVVSALVAGIVALVFGLPITWVYAKNRMENPWIYPLTGLVVGIGLIILWQFWLFTEKASPSPDLIWFIVAAGMAGALCGWLWWHFARRHMQESGGQVA